MASKLDSIALEAAIPIDFFLAIPLPIHRVTWPHILVCLKKGWFSPVIPSLLLSYLVIRVPFHSPIYPCLAQEPHGPYVFLPGWELMLSSSLQIQASSASYPFSSGQPGPWEIPCQLALVAHGMFLGAFSSPGPWNTHSTVECMLISTHVPTKGIRSFLHWVSGVQSTAWAELSMAFTF